MTVKTTISLPDEALSSLEQMIPESQREKFMASAIVDALRQKSREQAIEALSRMERYEAGEESVVESIREIREREAGKFNINKEK
jgi:hypothetical protein